MGHSSRLPLRDIRNVFHLLGEITELGADPGLWRAHMLTRLCAMTGARVGLTIDLVDALPGKMPRIVEPLDIGFDNQSEANAYIVYRSTDQRSIDPSTVAMLAQHQHQQLAVKTRCQLVDSITWYASPVTSEARRTSNVDDMLLATATLGLPGYLTGFSLYRNWAESGFTERDRRRVQLFFVELQRKLRPKPSTATDRLFLPPHLRQTLRTVLRGMTAKDAARSIGLSVHTINSYTRELFQKLEVTSRGELQAYFQSRPSGRPIFLPAAFDAALPLV